MANQKIQYTLGFTADTKQAKAQLRELQNQISSLMTAANTNNASGLLSKEISDASAAAARLKVQLQEATNASTGKLDLTKFSQSLAKSKMSIEDYKNALLTLGPQGAQVFANLATSITQAEMPMIRLSAKVKDLGQTLANTVKWQLSSTMIHGFMGAVQGAYGYAEDLNRSLNDIRIVTGQSTDQMAKFAKNANNAAKALSTTTVKYTEAALIYYQQGLKDDEVQDRTNTTIKMANVTGESASEVSSYMTAIWNNFDDGSKSLEYFGDVITALGAATAASSEEIAGGLEKFAAIADTVGLSYEYATAALTTIIDKTRQSEDVVGTALKTIFARIQGLQQDGVTDDGVTLNKYSKALENVGITILDNNGELKNMDTILDEMGSKWETLTKAQKVALAETVGGTRQYQQLIALMDNWDSMQENVDIARGAEGTLDEQAEIYAESWDAAKNRVKASLEDIYDSILNDKFFIGLNNFFAGFLNVLGDLIDGMGGFKGILLTIGVIAVKFFKGNLINTINTARDTLFSFTKKGREEVKKLREQTNDALKTMYSDSATPTGFMIGEAYATQAKAQDAYLSKAKELSAEEQKVAQLLLDQHKSLVANVVKQGEVADEAERAASAALRREQAKTKDSSQREEIANTKNKIEQNAAAEEFAHDMFDSINFEASEDSAKKQAIQTAKNIKKAFNDQIATEDGKANLEATLGDNFTEIKNIIDSIGDGDNLDTIREKYLNLLNTIDKANKKQSEKAQGLGVSEENIETFKKAGTEMGKMNAESMRASAGLNTFKENLDKLNQQNVNKFANGIISLASALGQLSMLINGFKSLSSAWDMDEDISLGERLTRTLSAMAFILPTVAAGFKFLADAEKAEALAKGISSATGKINSLVTKENTAAKLENANATKISAKAKMEEAGANTAETMTKGGEKATSMFGNISTILGNTWKLLGSIVKLMLKWWWVVAAIAAVFAIIKLSNKPAEDLKKAKEETKRCAEAAEEANNRYKELISTLEGLNSAEEQIRKMTERTVEWYEAISNANAEINELIKKYPWLADYVTTDPNTGLKSISEEGQEKLKAEEYKNKQLANVAENIAKDKEREAEIVNVKGYWNRNNNYAERLAEGGVSNLDDVEGVYAALGENLGNAIIKNKDFYQPILDAVWEDKRADELDAQELVSANTELWNSIFGSESEVPAAIRNSLATVVGEDLAQQIADKAQNLKLTNQDKEDYAKAQGYGFDNGKFYELDENGNIDKDKEVEISEESIKKAIAAIEVVNNTNGYTKEQITKAVNRSGTFTEEEANDSAHINTTEKSRAQGLREEFSDEDKKNWADYRDRLEEVYELEEEMADRISTANMAMNNGLEDLLSNYTDYIDILKNADDGSEEYATTIKKVKEDLALMFDIDADDLSDDFVTNTKNLNLMKRAAEGDLEALTALREAAALDYIANVKVDDEEAQAKLDIIRNQILNSEEFEDLEIGASLDDTEFVNALNSLLEMGVVTADQMQGILNSIGFEPAVSYEKVDLATAKKYTGEVMVSDGNGGYKVATQEMLTDETQTFYIPKINGSETKYRGSPKTTISSKNKNKMKDNKEKASGGNVKEAERYHVIKNVIEDIGKELDEIGKAKDRAFGKNKLKLMDEEIAKLNEMKNAQSQYLKEIEAYYKTDKKKIAAYGAKFDKEGRITNYDELMRKYGGNEEAMKALEQYEETYDLLKDQKAALEDIKNQIYDAALEKTQYKVDLKIDVNDDDLKYLDYLLEKLDDAAYDAAEAIANLGQQAAAQMSNISAYTQGINDIFKEHDLGDDAVSQFLNGTLTAEDLADMNFTEAEVEALRQYRDGLLEANQALMEIRDNVWNEVMEALEALSAEFDKQSETIDHLSGVLESYQNIIGIVGQEVLGITDDMMESFSDIAVDNAIDALTVSKAKMDQLTTAREELEAALLNPELTEEHREKLEEQLEATNEMLRDAENEMLSDWEAALQAANDAFEQTTTRAIDNFKNAMAGAFGDMDTLLDDFAKTKEIDEMYLDDYKKIYELSKLTRDLNKSIDDTDNIAAKQALRDIQKEINDLQEAGVELSQYDLDYLRKKYELRLAEIALEDAQNAKNQVRMTKDSEGNWSYTYTADQDNIDSAQQNYEDKLYAIQELSTNYIKDLESQIIDLSTSLAEEIAGIDRSVYASEEAYLAEVERITNFYNEKMAILSEQMNSALENNNEIYTQDWMNYSLATGYKISADEDFLTSFNETTLGVKTGFEDMQSYQQAFNDAIGNPDIEDSLLGQLSNAYATWKTRVDEAMKAAGTSTEDFKDVVVDAANTIDTETDEAAESMDELKESTEEAFQAALQAAQDFEAEYGGIINDIISQNEQLIGSLNDIIDVWSGIEEAANEAADAANRYNQAANNSGGGSGSGGNSGSGGGGGSTTPTKKWYVVSKTGALQMDGKISPGYAKKSGAEKWWEDNKQYANERRWSGISFVQMKTGGYTGEWGSSGKMAMLHEKELVLNADDTRNMLAMVEVVRDITKTIDLNANGNVLGLGGLMASMIPSSNSELNQNVEIHAEFPNATNRGEIEAAFDNLINRASQYANRK